MTPDIAAPSSSAALTRYGAAWRVAGVIALIALGILVYGYAINVPLLLDDVIQLRWVREHSLSDIWSARLTSYFRPLQFTAWRALTLNGLDLPAFHALNIVLHAANGTLVWLLFSLRARSSANRIQALAPFAAGALFLLYPFSYQAVPWVGSLGHPLALSLMLSSLALGLMAHSSASAWLKVASIALAIVAPFAHESGVLVAPLMTLLLLTDESARHPLSLRATLIHALPYWLVSLVCTAIVFGMNRAMGNRSTLDLLAESRLQNAVYFLQGLAYPVAPLAGALNRAAPAISDVQAVWLVCLPVVVILAVLFWRLGGKRMVVLSLGWYVIGVSPAWLLLNFNYVVDGPRLMYEAAPGAALLWCIPLALAWSHRARVAGPVLAGALSIVIAAGSAVFLADRADMYRQAERVTAQLAKAIPPDETTTTILVNFPQWLAPAQNTFAVGHEGISIVPQYTSMYDYILANTGRMAYVETVVVEDAKRAWRNNYAPFGDVRSMDDMQGRLRNAVRLLMTDLSTPNMTVYDAGGLIARDAPLPQNMIASFEDRFALLDGACDVDGPLLKAHFIWQSMQPVTQDVSTFVHVLREDGALVAQTDGLPVGNIARLTAWQPGDRWRETRLVPIPAGARGTFDVRVGAYPAAGGDRLAAMTPAGGRHANDSALVCRITLP